MKDHEFGDTRCQVLLAKLCNRSSQEACPHEHVTVTRPNSAGNV
jgi:hypothetical protein